MVQTTMEIDKEGYVTLVSKRLKRTAKSLDILLVTAAILFGILLLIAGWKGATIAVLVLLLNNHRMYHAAFAEGFRSGYRTAMDDEQNELGFVPERMEE